MGVSGLLPQLKEIQENITLESFRGKTLAIDSYAWLHKSTITCSWELAQDRHTDKYIQYFKRKIGMLRHFGVTPYFVFDGDNYDSKGNTEVGRERSRQERKEQALKLLAQGDKQGAYRNILQSIDVTPQMAKSVIEHLDQEGIQYVVAPYEADSQMVYLEKLGLVDGIISEDSDLLIFGAKCLLTKLNEHGSLVCIRRENFKKCRAAPIGLLNDAQLRVVACLSGCDYTAGVPGIGIVKAFKLVQKMGTLQKCLMNLRLEGKLKIPEDFEKEYEIADLSFQYQRVFNPITNEMSTLNEIPEHLSDSELLLRCIGPLHDLELHQKIARAQICPISKKPLLSREASLPPQGSHAQAPLARKTQSMPAPTPAKRTPKTTPVPTMKKSLKGWSIDSFFQLSQNKGNVVSAGATASSSSSAPTTPLDQTQQLSPTSKRRKLFHSTESKAPLTSSKFFKSKSMTESVPTTDPPESTVLGQMNSSDFELSDPDDHDGPEHGELVQKRDEEVPNGCKADFVVSSIGQEDGTTPKPTPETEESDPDVASPRAKADSFDDSLDEDSIQESPTTCRRIIGATVVRSATGGTSVSDIKKGLFQRYGFRGAATTGTPASSKKEHRPMGATPKSTSRSDRAPLGAVPHNVAPQSFQMSTRARAGVIPRGGQRTGLVRTRTKGAVTTNLTLDAFVYRG